MMGVAEDLLAEGGAITTKLAELGYSLANYSTGRNATVYEQIFQSQFITEHFDQFAGISDKLQELSYRFLGMNLGATPKLAFWNWDWSSASAWLPELGLFLIPAIAALLSYYSMKVSNASNPQTKDQQQQTKSMMLMMPLLSLWICFTMPGIMGIYWIAQSVFAIVQDVVLTKRFNRELDIEDADRIEREKAREAELEAKRLETERLKAEGATLENKNTSKKKKQAVAAQKEAERKAAEARAAKAAKRGGKGDDVPASQVGNRRYARGRAYVADRYSNPDEAEEKTQAAALESQEYDEELTETVTETEEVAATETLLEENVAAEDEAAVTEEIEDGSEEIEVSEETDEVDPAQEDEEPSDDQD
jgi:YidC/Oxa1 family membrane protein insertase